MKLQKLSFLYKIVCICLHCVTHAVVAETSTNSRANVVKGNVGK